MICQALPGVTKILTVAGLFDLEELGLSLYSTAAHRWPVVDHQGNITLIATPAIKPGSALKSSVANRVSASGWKPMYSSYRR
ncbi:hypothetical protein BN873_490053 [Candidatus Competibacter denitrificans Run_A_D11]|uniref:Uncharacterized protein n=1 Tax=Candidatus Competibacter denitrificans Run_A_D11 TaxID=1400863 RepID=W6M9W2_9GAMM|nr:hypothetical protein BN873_490053 [Candidatus Competibacter denitrificans Run_A_D11]